jgi:hypothetical protein
MIDISIEKSRHIEKIIMLSMDNSRNTQMEKFEKLQKKKISMKPSFSCTCKLP